MGRSTTSAVCVLLHGVIDYRQGLSLSLSLSLSLCTVYSVYMVHMHYTKTTYLVFYTPFIQFVIIIARCFCVPILCPLSAIVVLLVNAHGRLSGIHSKSIAFVWKSLQWSIEIGYIYTDFTLPHARNTVVALVSYMPTEKYTWLLSKLYMNHLQVFECT